jgi:hypothetical protein
LIFIGSSCNLHRCKLTDRGVNTHIISECYYNWLEGCSFLSLISFFLSSLSFLVCFFTHQQLPQISAEPGSEELRGHYCLGTRGIKGGAMSASSLGAWLELHAGKKMRLPHRMLGVLAHPCIPAPGQGHLRTICGHSFSG